MVVFDINARRLDVEVSEAVLSERLSKWQEPAPRYLSGVLPNMPPWCPRRRRGLSPIRDSSAARSTHLRIGLKAED